MTDKPNVYTAINAVMKEVGYVQKAGTNQHFKYKFASESDFISTLRPLMVENELVVVPVGIAREMTHVTKDSRAGDLVYLDYGFKMVHAPSGSETEVCRIPACGQDSGDKGPYKAMTGALKYFLRHIFLIETGDDPEKDVQQNGGGEAAPPTTRSRHDLTVLFEAQKNRLGQDMSRAILKDHGITSKAELEAMSLATFESVVKAMKDSVPKGGT